MTDERTLEDTVTEMHERIPWTRKTMRALHRTALPVGAIAFTIGCVHAIGVQVLAAAFPYYNPPPEGRIETLIIGGAAGMIAGPAVGAIMGPIEYGTRIFRHAMRKATDATIPRMRRLGRALGVSAGILGGVAAGEAEFQVAQQAYRWANGVQDERVMLVHEPYDFLMRNAEELADIRLEIKETVSFVRKGGIDETTYRRAAQATQSGDTAAVYMTVPKGESFHTRHIVDMFNAYNRQQGNRFAPIDRENLSFQERPRDGESSTEFIPYTKDPIRPYVWGKHHIRATVVRR